MPFIVDPKVADARSRPAFYSLLGLNLRLMENWRRVQTAITGRPLDCDTTMIMMAIVVIGGERLLRTGLPAGLQSLESQLPSDLIGQVNLSSIAAATSINRETVRRKIAELQDAGLVLREKGKVVVAPGVLQRHEIREIITAQINAIASTCRQLTKLGVIVSQTGPALLPPGSSRRSSNSPAGTAGSSIERGLRGAFDSG